MAEFSRIEYNFNNRIKFNDTTSDANKFILLEIPTITDTLSINTEDDKISDAGIIDYGTKLGKGQWVVPVKLFANSAANMGALIDDLKEALNPDMLEADTTYGDTTKYHGYHPLDWTDTIGSTSYNFRMYVKSQEIPQVAVDSFAGLIRRSSLKFKIADPRKYLQAESTLTVAPSDSGAAVNAGTFTTPIVITITATGATPTTLSITNTTTVDSIYVTTALANNDVLVIDTGTHSVKLNGVEKRSMLGSNTEWWLLNPGSNTLTLANDSNCSISFAWRSAWPL